MQPNNPSKQPVNPPEQPANNQQPVQPAGSPPDQNPSTVPPASPQQPLSLNNKPKKKWLIPAIIGGAVVLLLIAAGAAYALYQRPENVIKHSMANAFTATSLDAKLFTTIMADEQKIDVSGSLKGNAERASLMLSSQFPLGDSANRVSLDGSLVYTKDGTIYVKVDKLEELIRETAGADADAAIESLQPVIDKVDGQWIRATRNELKELGADTSEIEKASTCSENLQAALQDRGNQQQLERLYDQHQFINIDQQLPDQTIAGKSSFGYKLSFREQATYDFVNAASQLQFVKDYNSCTGESSEVKRSDFDELNKDSRFELYVEKWGHAITQIKVTGTGEAQGNEVRVEPVFNTNVNVEVPSNATSIKDIVNDEQIQSTLGLLFLGALSSQMSTDMGGTEL